VYSNKILAKNIAPLGCEELSSEVFGKPLAELSDAEMQVIYRAIPMNVSEIEPKDIRR
jgi:hypothetical protein